MEDGRAYAEERSGDQQQSKGRREGQENQANEGAGHADGQRPGQWAPIREVADKWLQQRGGDLEGQGNQADLAEIQMKRGFQDRVDGGQQRLDHVVEEMAEADGGEDANQRRWLRQGNWSFWIAGLDGSPGFILAFDGRAQCEDAVIDVGETKTIHYLSLAILPVALLSALVR